MQSLIVDALATYRITKLAIDDTFPPVKALRKRAMNATKEGSWQEELLQCPWCLSFWIGLGVVVARRIAPGWWEPFGKAFAMSAVTGLLSEKD